MSTVPRLFLFFLSVLLTIYEHSLLTNHTYFFLYFLHFAKLDL